MFNTFLTIFINFFIIEIINIINIINTPQVINKSNLSFIFLVVVKRTVNTIKPINT